MKQYRMNRLFNEMSGNCFDVAMDQGMFNEPSFLKGIENIQRAIDIVIKASPDAIQVTSGNAGYLQSIRGKRKPALVLRTDVANVYGKELPDYLFSRMIENPVEQAVGLDAACVVVNLFSIPGEPHVSDHCIQNILKIKPLAEKYCMPLMIEPLVFRPNHEAGGYQVDGNVNKIIPLVRQAIELGADIIKADPTDDLNDYKRVVEVAGNIPVLVRGGGAVGEMEILRRTYGLMQQGVRGIVYGRNVIQHINPKGMTAALMSIVHKGKTPDEAKELLKD